MWIYGHNPVLEALRQQEVHQVLVADGVKAGRMRELSKAARQAGVATRTVPRIELDRALGTTAHQGVAAELPELHYADLEDAFARADARQEPPLLLLLDQVQDPRNYGAIIRSAEVLGAHGVVTESRRSAPLSAVVSKTSAGAASHLPLIQVANLANLLRSLKERGVWVYGADAAGASRPEEVDWDRPVALVIGSEGTGLRRLTKASCDELVRIPTHGTVASLNASVATGVLLYAVQIGRGPARS